MDTRFRLIDTRFRGSQFKERDDGILWIVIWFFFNLRLQEYSGIILDRITKGILFFYARIAINPYGFDLIRVKCGLKILRIIWIYGDNHAFTIDRFGTNDGIVLVEEIGMWRQYKKSGGGGVYYITVSSFLAFRFDKKTRFGCCVVHHDTGTAIGNWWSHEGGREHSEKIEDIGSAF